MFVCAPACRCVAVGGTHVARSTANRHCCRDLEHTVALGMLNSASCAPAVALLITMPYTVLLAMPYTVLAMPCTLLLPSYALPCTLLLACRVLCSLPFAAMRSLLVLYHAQRVANAHAGC
jgi:hypothetical protein